MAFGNGTRPVSIVDVSPRDGLQNEKTPVSTEDKVRLIEELIRMGARRIEAARQSTPLSRRHETLEARRTHRRLRAGAR